MAGIATGGSTGPLYLRSDLPRVGTGRGRNGRCRRAGRRQRERPALVVPSGEVAAHARWRRRRHGRGRRGRERPSSTSRSVGSSRPKGVGSIDSLVAVTQGFSLLKGLGFAAAVVLLIFQVLTRPASTPLGVWREVLRSGDELAYLRRLTHRERRFRSSPPSLVRWWWRCWGTSSCFSDDDCVNRTGRRWSASPDRRPRGLHPVPAGLAAAGPRPSAADAAVGSGRSPDACS